MTNIAFEAEQDLFTAFLDWLWVRGRKAATLKAYQSAHRSLFESVSMAAPKLTDLSGYDLRQWKTRALEFGAKPAAINHRLGFLRLYVRWAALQGHLGKEQAELLRAIPDVPITRLGVKTLTDEEFKRFMGVVESQASLRDRTMIFLLLSGLRVSEVCGLKREDVILNAHRGHLEVHGNHVKFSAARQVPLGRQARFYLLKHLENVQPASNLFLGERGNLTTDGAYKMVRKIGEQAGVTLHPHILRHQFSRLWLASNANDLVGLQAVLGHANIRTTARFYARKSLADLSAAVDAINL